MANLTLKQIEKKYGDMYFVLCKLNNGCFHHSNVGECNSVMLWNATGKKCEKVYEVRSVSKQIKQNHNDINYYFNKEI